MYLSLVSSASNAFMDSGSHELVGNGVVLETKLPASNGSGTRTVDGIVRAATTDQDILRPTTIYGTPDL